MTLLSNRAVAWGPWAAIVTTGRVRDRRGVHPRRNAAELATTSPANRWHYHRGPSGVAFIPGVRDARIPSDAPRAKALDGRRRWCRPVDLCWRSA